MLGSMIDRKTQEALADAYAELRQVQLDNAEALGRIAAACERIATVLEAHSDRPVS